MNLIRILIMLSVFGLLGFMTSPLGAAEPPKAENLKFSLLFAKTSFKTGEAVSCKMQLTNSGQTPLPVNRRFLVNWPFPSPHEVYFVIKNAKGNQLPFQLLIRAGEPQAKDFITLSPGESVKSDPLAEITGSPGYNLSQAYNLTQAGSYTIYAVYENQTSPPGLNAWTGKLNSQTVKITIK